MLAGGGAGVALATWNPHTVWQNWPEAVVTSTSELSHTLNLSFARLALSNVFHFN